jgi:1,4-alpha-glucan branching enzyme
VGAPRKKLIFMGDELAQEQLWSEKRSLDWHLLQSPEHSGIHSLVRDLNRAYRDEPALWERDFDPTGFWWIQPNDAENSVFAFARTGKDASKPLVLVANLSPVPRHGYRLGLPVPGRWTEIGIRRPGLSCVRPVAVRRDAGEHSLQDHPAERVAGAEVAVGPKRHLLAR